MISLISRPSMAVGRMSVSSLRFVFGDHVYGGGPAEHASGPPPPGYRWAYVTNNGERVSNNTSFVVALEPI